MSEDDDDLGIRVQVTYLLANRDARLKAALVTVYLWPTVQVPHIRWRAVTYREDREVNE